MVTVANKPISPQPLCWLTIPIRLAMGPRYSNPVRMFESKCLENSSLRPNHIYNWLVSIQF
jgi:hypothetical protein